MIAGAITRIANLFRRRAPAPVRIAAQVLLLTLTPEGAWHTARKRRNEAADHASDRHWSAVMREVERATGWTHGGDTATRYLETQERDRRARL